MTSNHMTTPEVRTASRGTQTRQRVLTAVFALVASLGASLLVAAPAQASAADSPALCRTFADCTTNGYVNHGYSSHLYDIVEAGNGYWRMDTGHNCTNYVAYLMYHLGFTTRPTWLDGSGFARDWGAAAKNANLLSDFPANGAVAWWGAGKGGYDEFGHVAYVESYTATTITVSEDGANSDFNWKTIPIDADVQFIHIRDYFDATDATIGGTNLVDSYLTASAAGWAPAPTNVGYQWNRNGLSIPGATGSSYKLTQADIGQNITVTVTGARSGYATTSKISGLIVGAAYSLGSPTVTISGTKLVDSSLVANPSTPVSGVGIGYQWYRNGAAIIGSTAKTYAINQGDIGASFTVKVTWSKTGYQTVSKTSAAAVATAKQMVGPITATITGTARQNAVLTSHFTIGESSTGLLIGRQWYRNGVPIPGAYGVTYKLTSADVGRQVSVKITFTKSGYRTTTVSSPATATIKSIYQS